MSALVIQGDLIQVVSHFAPLDTTALVGLLYLVHLGRIAPMKACFHPFHAQSDTTARHPTHRHPFIAHPLEAHVWAVPSPRNHVQRGTIATIHRVLG